MALATGRIVGQFVLGVVDGADVDQEPDIIPAQGTITFSGAAPYIPLVDASPNPVTLMTTSIVAALDAEGYLTTPNPFNPAEPGTRGVRLFANDDPSSPVQGWTWTVTYRFAVSNGATPTIPAHSIAVLSGAELDLTTVVKVPASPGVGEAQAFALVGRAEAAATQAALDAAVALEVKARADAGEFKGEPGPAGPNTVPTDTAIATNIQTPGTETEAALNAAIGSAVDPKADANQATILPSTNVVATCGDSITNASGASSGRGYAQIIRYVAGTRNVDQVYKIYATGGWTSTQILGTHIPAACSGAAAVVHVAWGTNDAGTGVTVATFAANTIEAHRQITAAGKRMSIRLIPPRGSGATAAWRKDRAAYNEWISRWAPLANVPVADTSTLTDPATGHLAASCDSGDGTHPNDTGHARLAKAVSAAVLQALPTQPHRPVKAPDVNLLPNGTIGTIPTAGFPGGWSEFAGGTGTAPTYSTKADTTGTLKEGLWLEMDWNATAGGERRIKAGGLTKDSGWAALEQAEIGMVFQLEDVSGFAAALEAGTASIAVDLVSSDGVSVQGTMLPPIRTTPGRIAYRVGMPNTTFPSISVKVTVPSGVHVKVRVGEATLYNLTALGVTRSVVGS